MKILGLVGSRRKLGNSEILVKEALKVARSEGASVELLRISDLYIQECNGCMACMIRKQPCRLQDDMNFLGEKIEAADGLVVGAPSYHYRPPASLMILDYRVLGLVREMKQEKKAITIGLAAQLARAGWIIPLMNFFVREAGFELLGSFLAVSAGPGEVLLPERTDIVKEVGRLARDLVFSVREEGDRLSPYVNKLRVFDPRAEGRKLFTDEDCCPYCFSKAFHFISPTQVRCAFCFEVIGRVVPKDSGVGLDFAGWSVEEIMHAREQHIREIIPTGDWFQEHRTELNTLRAGYSDVGIPWQVPLGREANLPSLSLGK